MKILDLLLEKYSLFIFILLTYKSNHIWSTWIRSDLKKYQRNNKVSNSWFNIITTILTNLPPRFSKKLKMKIFHVLEVKYEGLFVPNYRTRDKNCWCRYLQKCLYKPMMRLLSFVYFLFLEKWCLWLYPNCMTFSKIKK